MVYRISCSEVYGLAVDASPMCYFRSILKNLCLAGLCYGLAGFSLKAATPEDAKDQLRRLLKLPTVTVVAGFSFDPREGFSMLVAKRDVSGEISKLVQEVEKEPRPERFYELGELYSESNDQEKAKAAFARAAELYGQRAGVDGGGDALLLMRYGEALLGAGESDRAERILLDAVRIEPEQWRCWVSLGRLYEGRAMMELGPMPEGTGRLIPEGMESQLLRDRPSALQVENARRWLREAGRCFDAAVAKAPGAAQAYLARAMHCSVRGLIDVLTGPVAPDEPGNAILRGMLSRECLPDLRRASALSASDVEIIASTALFEAFSWMLENPQSDSSEPVWAAVPERVRASVREAMTRLENLGQHHERKVAGSALSALAVLQLMVVRDDESAIANLRRAIRLDSGLEQAWDLLAALLAQVGRHEELAEVCRERVEAKGNTRNRVLLAKAYVLMSDLDKAEDQVRLAVRTGAKDFPANLALAVLMLKKGDDPVAMAVAQQYLVKAAGLKKSPEELVELAVATSVFYFLNGKHEEARQVIRQATRLDKDNGYAREIASIIEAR